jgi:tetracycline 7-halogenase / FADH2 O2-dependent halogenase
VTSAGFLLSPRGLATLPADASAATLWSILLNRYPTLARAFSDAQPLLPIAFRPAIQHRLARAAGERWALMPHAFAFVDPLFSTGIAWTLRAIERLALAFEQCAERRRVPDREVLARYDSTLSAEAEHIDLVVAGAYEAMSHFDLFAAQAALYFGTVSFAEVSQRLAPDDHVAWKGFLGVDDAVLQPLARESLTRLRKITKGRGEAGSPSERDEFAHWLTDGLGPRNVAGLGDPNRNNLYPVDFDKLVEQHALLGMSREALIARLPALRGMAPAPVFRESPSPSLETMKLPAAPSGLAAGTLRSPS